MKDKVVFLGFGDNAILIKHPKTGLISPLHPSIIIPIKNDIYTIREIIENTDGIFYLLNEIINTGFDIEPAWNSLLFRPVDYSYGENITKQIEKKFLVEV